MACLTLIGGGGEKPTNPHQTHHSRSRRRPWGDGGLIPLAIRWCDRLGVPYARGQNEDRGVSKEVPSENGGNPPFHAGSLCTRNDRGFCAIPHEREAAAARPACGIGQKPDWTKPRIAHSVYGDLTGAVGAVAGR